MAVHRTKPQKKDLGAVGKMPVRSEVVQVATEKAAGSSFTFFEGQDRPMHELTGMEKIKLVREGLTKKDLDLVKEAYGLDYETLARVLSVAKATLFNKKGAARFGAALSEKIFALADLYSYGISVFGEKERLNQWMETNNKALGYVRPLDLLDTLIGIGETKNILGRIEHGVYS